MNAILDDCGYLPQDFLTGSCQKGRRLRNFVTIAPTMLAASPELISSMSGRGPTEPFSAWEPISLRYGFIAALAAFAVVIAPAVKADDAPKDVKGLFLMSDYPAVTVRPGETSSVGLHLQNYSLPPQRMTLSVGGVPTGWTATLMGGGQPV